MELIQRECQRLNRFVTDLLNYSKERDLAIQSLEIGGQLAELRDVIARDPRCVAGTTVVLEGESPDARVRADGEMLRQVWLNLAANALEAMPEGGTLSLRWREGDAGQVVVEFADTGTGVAEEDLPRVGQPFFTTKKGGTGLGLAIAQRIVERHGGTFAFESATARGTVVRVTLPGATADISLQAA
jgi:signal transduction histidine kinase